MTTITDQPNTGQSKDGPGSSTERPWPAAIREVLDRPLTSYHILLGATVLLLVLGLLMVLSASSVLSLRANGNSYTIFYRQLIWVGVGLPMAYVASRMTPRHFRMLSYVALLGSVFLLVLTYVPGLGVGVKGNTNWLNLGGPLQIQPSEFAKLALVMWCADLYARKQKLLTQWKHLLVPMVPVCGLVIALIVGQHDLGTALVLMAVMLGMIWVVGAPTRLFVATIVVVGTIAMYFVTTAQHRMDRLMNFTNPLSDPGGVGWQAYHSFYALSTGGWWGVGIGNSRQKWGNLPEAHTDFIFSVIGEELGLIGSLTVLALFLTLAYVGVRIATRNTDPFVRYASAGITVWLMAQTLVNLGAVIGLLPIVGIPLPLLSYGGSALLPTLIAIGMLLSFAKAEPGAQAALKETRRPRFGWMSSWRTPGRTGRENTRER
ncbi:cell division protein FtsW [Kribbella orskensis]|uniref:Probable peptidoglycan glycosyltransferase FtsW n=1 Tax=Kribbella orskensis TaxID=2512216 RepID=A0ABY2BRX9_9ACTN|nr:MULTISPECIES: putative lipid II flippase FtsW [Kribbella]TCN43009.1 cell division protein FtsW [Kribbella sp. VKM Ac-2500]TCO29635.1 cell division protein FtsW [Kribbella orskensis]